MEPQSIYAQVLGPDFGGLAPALKRLHDCQRRHFAGVLTVRSGPHPLARLALWLGRLPKAQVDAPCRLCLISSKRGEWWQREFGRWKFITHQRAAFSEGNPDGEIWERFGAITLGLHLRVKGRGLCVRSGRTWILGVPLPRWLGVKVVAHERAVNDDSFYCNVRVYLPGAGVLLQYRGKLRKL